MKINTETVRGLALYKQGLTEHPSKKDKMRILKIINKIGLLQLDTINVVERSHYLVMFSRLGNYDTKALDSLLYPDKKTFEQWAHAVSIIPMGDYPYIASVMEGRYARGPQYREWLYKHVKNPDYLLKHVAERIKREGPLATRHFDDGTKRSGTWWNWKPSKDAIQVLYCEGTLMVEKRIGFQRYYNLTERVLPKNIASIKVSPDNAKRWFILKALSCMGVATMKQIADYYRRRPKETAEILKLLVDEGIVVEVAVDGWKDGAYIRKKDMPVLREIQKGLHKATLTTFLSPFDNLIWDRDRTKLLFNFHYRISVYDSVKKKPRVHGYYVMPILYKGGLIGRIDPKADRKSGTLIIHKIHIEPEVKITRDMIKSVDNALKDFMLFNKCKSLMIESSDLRV